MLPFHVLYGIIAVTLPDRGNNAMQAQIAASLRHLKEAAAHLSEAVQAIGDADKAEAANMGSSQNLPERAR
jgi:hypothetical protein